MQASDRIDGRWRLVTQVPTPGPVERWRALDEHEGRTVEILRLPRSVEPPRRRAFVAAHQVLERLFDAPPAPDTIVPTDRVHAEEAFVVREALSDPTLAQVSGPLEANQVAAIGAALLPAVLAAGPALQGVLRARDVGLDEAGQPLLAPLGESPTALDRDTAEVLDRGAGTDEDRALYSLGVLLYRLAVGHPPRRAMDQGAVAPPSSLRPGLDPALDGPILQLLSADSPTRRGALSALRACAGPLEDLRGHVQVHPASEPVQLTTAPHGPAKASQVVPGAMVVVPVGALGDLDPAARSVAAGVSGRSGAQIAALIRADRPLVLASGSTARHVRPALQEAQQAGLPAEIIERPSLAPFAPSFVLGALATVMATVLPVAWLLDLWVLMVPALMTTLVAGVLAVPGALRQAPRRRAWSTALSARDADPSVAREAPGATLRTRLAQVRRELAATDLPTAADLDLREILTSLEQRLETLLDQDRAHARTLDAVDGQRLRRRLRILEQTEGTDPEERNRLSRTLADLDAVAAERRAVDGQMTEIRDALDELVAVLGRLGPDPADTLLEDLAKTTLRHRQAAQRAQQARRTERS